jgi:cation diffusion facilitator family transporter
MNPAGRTFGDKYIMDPGKQRLGYIEGFLSSALNIVLFGFKLWVGVRIASVAMVADAWHTLSDILTSIVVIVGFWMASRPGDREHPFGHGRAELVGAVIIGTLLALVGANFIRESYLQLKEAVSPVFDLSGIIVFGISAILKEALAEFSLWAGKKSGSSALIADGWHHRSDAIASALIVLGVLFGKNFWWIDGVLGLAVSLLIIYAAYEVISSAGRRLLGEAPDAGLIEDIKAVLKPILPDTADLHHIHLHRYGDHVEVTMHVYLPDGYSLKKAHDIINFAEAELKEKLKIEPTIHTEPLTDKKNRGNSRD